jgi:hypothetical protein
MILISRDDPRVSSVVLTRRVRIAHLEAGIEKRFNDECGSSRLGD